MAAQRVSNTMYGKSVGEIDGSDGVALAALEVTTLDTAFRRNPFADPDRSGREKARAKD